MFAKRKITFILTILSALIFAVSGNASKTYAQTCSYCSHFDGPADGATLTIGTTQLLWGWAYFGYGPAGEGIARWVDMYISNRGSLPGGAGWKYIGQAHAPVTRGDTIGANWCGDGVWVPAPGNTGWNLNWTVGRAQDGTYVPAGNYDLWVAPVNSAAAVNGCIGWKSKPITLADITVTSDSGATPTPTPATSFYPTLPPCTIPGTTSCKDDSTFELCQNVDGEFVKIPFQCYYGNTICGQNDQNIYGCISITPKPTVPEISLQPTSILTILPTEPPISPASNDCSLRNLSLYPIQPERLYNELCENGSLGRPYSPSFGPSGNLVGPEAFDTSKYLILPVVQIPQDMVGPVTGVMDDIINGYQTGQHNCYPLLAYGYRPYETQSSLYNALSGVDVAPPGNSTHQSGVAIDMFCAVADRTNNTIQIQIDNTQSILNSVPNSSSIMGDAGFIHPARGDLPHYIYAY